MKTLYISQLPSEVTQVIYKEIEKSLIENDLKGKELEEAIEAAMNSKLTDLEDTIDITKYI